MDDFFKLFIQCFHLLYVMFTDDLHLGTFLRKYCDLFTLSVYNLIKLIRVQIKHYHYLPTIAAGKPEGSVHFLFTTKWPESNKQRKTARDREAFPKHSDRTFAVDSIISLSRCPVISMIITNCLALKTHFGGELRL